MFAGLNLLRLLLANRIAEFHTELELIPEQVRLQGAQAARPPRARLLLGEGYSERKLVCDAHGVSTCRGSCPSQQHTYSRALLTHCCCAPAPCVCVRLRRAWQQSMCVQQSSWSSG